MKSNFHQSLAWVLESEGGFVNNPADPGGMTNLGVTRRAWQDYFGRSISEAEMRALTPLVVTPFYRVSYWNAIRGDELPAGLDYALFDFAVNSGVHRASLSLQSILGATQDGIIGPITLSKVRLYFQDHTDILIKNLTFARLDFLHHLPTWPTFGKGWEARVKKVQENALTLL